MVAETKSVALRSGDILSCRSRSWLAKAIQWFTKSRFNHTALVIEIWDTLFVIDSQKDGTNLRPLTEWLKKYKYTFEVHRPKDFTTEHRERAVSKVGHTPYDFSSLLIYQPWYILTGKWKGRKKAKAAERLYCSEFVAWVFNIPEWWKMSPQALYELLDTSSDFKKALMDNPKKQ